MNWVAPAGALCDAARPGWIVYKQGDGRIGIHDRGMEFTAADQSYVDAATKLCDGLEKVLNAYKDSDQPIRRKIHRLWTAHESN